jgi:hypothetical protein
LKSQMLAVPAIGEKRDSVDFLTNVYLTISPLSVHRTSFTQGITKSMVVSLLKFPMY